MTKIRISRSGPLAGRCGSAGAMQKSRSNFGVRQGAQYERSPCSLKCSSAIRCHHLLKTFWTGRGGWADKQSPDGTVTWRSPSGRTYTTKPGGSLFFPLLATPTGELKLEKLADPTQERGLMMPRRKRTRKQEREERIAAERQINEQLIKRQLWLFAELEKRRQARTANEPPPF